MILAVVAGCPAQPFFVYPLAFFGGVSLLLCLTVAYQMAMEAWWARP